MWPRTYQYTIHLKTHYDSILDEPQLRSYYGSTLVTNLSYKTFLLPPHITLGKLPIANGTKTYGSTLITNLSCKTLLLPPHITLGKLPIANGYKTYGSTLVTNLSCKTLLLPPHITLGKLLIANGYKPMVPPWSQTYLVNPPTSTSHYLR
jgi:hypothetical protein